MRKKGLQWARRRLIYTQRDLMAQIGATIDRRIRQIHEERDVDSQLIGITEVDWFNPSVNPPPFNAKLLVMVAGSRSDGFGRPLEPYTEVITAYVQRQGPGDEYDDEPAFDEYMAGDQTDFLDFQFYLIDVDGETLYWFSDAIVSWAYYPSGIAQTAVNVERERQAALAHNAGIERL